MSAADNSWYNQYSSPADDTVSALAALLPRPSDRNKWMRAAAPVLIRDDDDVAQCLTHIYSACGTVSAESLEVIEVLDPSDVFVPEPCPVGYEPFECMPVKHIRADVRDHTDANWLVGLFIDEEGTLAMDMPGHAKCVVVPLAHDSDSIDCFFEIMRGSTTPNGHAVIVLLTDAPRAVVPAGYPAGYYHMDFVPEAMRSILAARHADIQADVDRRGFHLGAHKQGLTFALAVGRLVQAPTFRDSSSTVARSGVDHVFAFGRSAKQMAIPLPCVNALLSQGEVVKMVIPPMHGFTTANGEVDVDAIRAFDDAIDAMNAQQAHAQQAQDQDAE